MKRAPGFAGGTIVSAADASGRVGRYDVRRPTRVCEAPDARSLVCYRARCADGEPRRAPASVWVAHALGSERLRGTGVKELCLPAEPVD